MLAARLPPTAATARLTCARTGRFAIGTPAVGSGFVVADREYYVGHDYNETQAIAALLPITGGTAVIYTNRTTTDQLGGFGAIAKQAIGRSMMSKQLREIFEESRSKLAKQAAK